MIRASPVLRFPTERSWSWAPHRKKRDTADFPPLRILFCGSDSFSVPTFHMLRELHLRRADIVSQLSVITPSDKLSGRGMSLRKAAPMTLLARQMKYPISHVSGFSLKASDLPEGDWDLVIAVSFGHKITASALEKMTYGGLNIHPSLLPRYRGPAPLHHALLNNDDVTGVSIQTIHPTEFDKGDVLKQSLPIPLVDHTLQSLHSKTAILGSTMLRELLMAGYPTNCTGALTSTLEESYAGKISRDQMQIRWSEWPTAKIEKWAAVLDSLWTKLGDRVVKVNGLTRLDRTEFSSTDATGHIRVLPASHMHESALVVRTIDSYIKIERLTLAGKKEKKGSDAKELDDKLFVD